jgi:hypothetical protein
MGHFTQAALTVIKQLFQAAAKELHAAVERLIAAVDADANQVSVKLVRTSDPDAKAIAQAAVEDVTIVPVVVDRLKDVL